MIDSDEVELRDDGALLETAKCAYHVYAQAANEPDWDTLPETKQRAWVAAIQSCSQVEPVLIYHMPQEQQVSTLEMAFAIIFAVVFYSFIMYLIVRLIAG